MKKFLSLLCLAAAVALVAFSISGIKKRSKDPYVHAAEIQHNPEYVGERASALVKVPFYANYAALPLSDGMNEYAFFPMIDSTPDGSGIILAGFRTSDEEISSIMSSISRLLKEECKRDNSNLDDRNGHVLSGHMISFDSLFEGYEKEVEEYLEEYRDSFLSLPGVKESVGSSYYDRSSLILMIDTEEAPMKKRITALNIISFLSAAVLLIASVALLVSASEDYQ